MIRNIISREVRAAILAKGIDADELLRKALNLGHTATGDWECKGVTFPEGTFFRCWYQDRPYWGVVKSGALEIKGSRFTTPSAAAEFVTGKATSGWAFWECRFPGERKWRVLTSLRAEH